MSCSKEGCVAETPEKCEDKGCPTKPVYGMTECGTAILKSVKCESLQVGDLTIAKMGPTTGLWLKGAYGDQSLMICQQNDGVHLGFMQDTKTNVSGHEFAISVTKGEGVTFHYVKDGKQHGISLTEFVKQLEL